VEQIHIICFFDKKNLWILLISLKNVISNKNTLTFLLLFANIVRYGIGVKVVHIYLCDEKFAKNLANYTKIPI